MAGPMWLRVQLQSAQYVFAIILGLLGIQCLETKDGTAAISS